MAEVSRIFVRGLPPGMKENDFKKHFAAPSPITDAKLIPHRRIGYVGYKTPDAAAKAVKYFNKSFIRMSRIGVEFAKPVEELKLEKPSEFPVQTSLPSSKRKHESELNLTTNPKLKEFLDVMAPPSKTKVWSNEDYIPARNVVGAERASHIPEEDGQSDAEYEPVPKKRKKSSSSTEESKQISLPTERPKQQVMESDGLEVERNHKIANENGLVQNSAPTSDTDWLRSRTSRLLGLVDDDELDLVQDFQRAPQESKTPTTIREDEEAVTRRSDAGSQTDQESQEADKQSDDTYRKSQDNLETGRLFLRNLSYETNTDDLRSLFETYGILEEVHIPTDGRSGLSKGFAYVNFEDLNAAKNAQSALDGKPFQGRLMHIIPAAPKKEHYLDDYEVSKLPLKKQRQVKRKAEAASATFKWNSMYMNPDAVMSSISSRLGISKSELLDPTSTDAAVQQAHAETNIIQETKAYLSLHGVDLGAFRKQGFSDSVILVKNFPYGTSGDEIKKMFEAHGNVKGLLMPPSATIAIIEMEQPGQARSAFGALAYRKFKDSILFLEKAPKDIFTIKGTPSADVSRSDRSKISASDLLEQTSPAEGGMSSTIFVRNLNFSTTTERLCDLFRPLNGFMSARVKTKTDSKKPGQLLSMGFGFVEFQSKQDAQSAIAAMNGYQLDGHDLLIKESHKALDAAEARKKEDLAKKIAARRTKVIIKNLPFETSKKEVRALFGPYGQLRSVRVPKKFDSSTRGFAFADFVTVREAENAMIALQGTHLLGRRLNLEFAAEDIVDPEEEIETKRKKVGRQTDKVATQQLIGAGRKKFTIQDDVDDIV